MKRFITFSFGYYEPLGGMSDFAGFFDDFETAKSAGKQYVSESSHKSFQIFDTEHPDKYYDITSFDESYRGENNEWVKNIEIKETWQEIEQ